MTDLAKLVVRLEAETAKYQAELEKAKRQLGGFESGMNASIKRIGTAVGAATVAAAAGFAAMIKNSLDTADNMSKLAQATGLSTEAISQLQYAADLSGVEDLGGRLVKFNKTIAEAAQGSKEQADAFKVMGVNLRDVDGNLKSTEQLLLETADAFAEHADGAGKTALALDLFGKSGAAIIPLMNGGAAAIREAMAEADALGLTLDQYTGKSAEAFNDNITRLQKALQGLANKAAERLAPALQVMSDKVINVVKNSDALKTAMTGLEIIFKTTVSGLAILAEAFAYVGRVVGATAAAIVLAAQGEFRAAWTAIQDGAREAHESAGQLGQTLFELWNETETFSAKAEEAGQKAPPAFEAVAASAEKASTKVVQLDDHAKQLIATEERLRGEGERLTESLRTPNEVWAAQVALIDRLYNGGYVDAETRTRALSRANEDLYKALDANEGQAVETFSKMSAFAEEAARNMQDAFADFLFDPFQDGLDGMLKSFLQTLQRMAANAAASRIFEMIGSAASSSDYGWVQAIGGAIAGARADGGPVAGGSAYLVGERGPELFIPSSSGMIAPNESLGGNVNVSVTVNVPESTSREDSERIAREARDGIVSVIRAELVKERRPGGILATS